MAQVLSVLVPLAVALISSTWRWPTLRRRLREHLALAKDLPATVNGTALNELIEQELDELSRRERRRIETQADRRVALLRWAIFVVMVAIGTTQVVRGYTSGGPPEPLSWEDSLRELAFISVLILTVVFIVGMSWLFAGMMLWLLSRLRPERQDDRTSRDSRPVPTGATGRTGTLVSPPGR